MKSVITSMLLVVLLLAGCKLIDPAEDVATMVNIQPFTVQDSSTNNSYAQPSSVFVFYNNKTIGTFLLPASVPVIATQGGELRVVPGVTKNGTKAYQAAYLPYYNHTQKLDPQPGKQITINPSTGYRKWADDAFEFKENFDMSSNFVHASGDSCFKVQTVTDCTICGSGTGVFTLDENHNAEEIVSASFITKGSQIFYLELNYRNTVDFEVGLLMVDPYNTINQYYMVSFKPKSTWNKVYIPLNETMNLYTGAQRVYIMFRTSLPSGSTSGKVELDNIRVLGF